MPPAEGSAGGFRLIPTPLGGRCWCRIPTLGGRCWCRIRRPS